VVAVVEQLLLAVMDHNQMEQVEQEVLEHQIILQEQLRVTQVVAVVEVMELKDVEVLAVEVLVVKNFLLIQQMELQTPVVEVEEVVQHLREEQVVQVSLSQEQVQLQELLSQLVLDVQEACLT
tara:strand:- start:822 stop:1190 length:369 start_codon:yes stop_codon:yes gene_type:complete